MNAPNRFAMTCHGCALIGRWVKVTGGETKLGEPGVIAGWDDECVSVRFAPNHSPCRLPYAHVEFIEEGDSKPWRVGDVLRAMLGRYD